jgi:hypothetical protein
MEYHIDPSTPWNMSSVRQPGEPLKLAICRIGRPVRVENSSMTDRCDGATDQIAKK